MLLLLGVLGAACFALGGALVKAAGQLPGHAAELITSRFYGSTGEAFDRRTGCYSQGGSLELVEVDATAGLSRRITRSPCGESDPSYSPDGLAIAYDRSGGRAPGIYVMRSDGTTSRLVQRRGSWPSWSPDGSRIAFVYRQGLAIVDADGHNFRTIISRTPADRWYTWVNAPQWLPDGRHVGYWTLSDPPCCVRTRSISGDQQKLIPAPSNFVDSNPSWSPKGDKIVFEESECEGSRIYCGSFGVITLLDLTTGTRTQLSSSVGHYPTWSPDGSEVAFVDDSGHTITFVRVSDHATRSVVFPRGAGSSMSPPARLSWRPRCTVRGTGAGDHLNAHAGGDLVCGLGGNDTIRGGRAADRLFGEDGDDVIYARGGGDDVVGCGTGIDIVYADRQDVVGVDCERVNR